MSMNNELTVNKTTTNAELLSLFGDKAIDPSQNIPDSPFEKGINDRGGSISGRFNSLTTGAKGAENDSFNKLLNITYSPALLNALNGLKTFRASTDFRKLGKFCAYFQNQIPQKNMQCTHLLSPLEVMENLHTYETVQDVPVDLIERSQKPVSLLENTAMIEGSAIWEQLPWEKNDFFTVFKVYRDSRYVYLPTGETLCQPRSLGQLVKQLSLNGVLLSTLSEIYGWPYRIAYYDAYMDSITRGYQQMAQKLVVSTQLKMSQDLQDKAFEAVKVAIRNFRPQDLVKLLELALKFSRISVDLPADKPSVDAEKPTLNIYNTTNNKADQIMSVNSVSATEDKLKENLQSPENLLSILHVLQASGAMRTALEHIPVDSVDVLDPADEGMEPIEVACLPTPTPITGSPTSLSKDIATETGEEV